MTDLIVPVYLNQRLVFDLVAMMQNGISTVSRLEVRAVDENKDRSKMEAKFGLADAFGALLKIDLGGAKEGERSSASQRTESTERTHTTASLFSILRADLNARNLIVSPEDSDVRPGDFVEFSASMKRNPLIAGLEQVTQFLSLAGVFDVPSAGDQKKGKPKMGTAESELLILARQLQSVNDKLKQGGTGDLFATNVAGRYSAVVTLENQFLNDPAMSDLIDGTFSVLGKVIRVVREGERISLVRNSAISMSPEFLNVLVESFMKMQATPGFSVPDMAYEVDGPAFQVLPVAIYS